MSLLFSSLLSLVIGTVVGLTQSRIKRLYAFSTISHVGFILLGLSIHTVESTQAFMFYLIQYSVSNLNAFMLIIAIGYSLYCFVYKKKNTNDMNEIVHENKMSMNDTNEIVHENIEMNDINEIIHENKMSMNDTNEIVHENNTEMNEINEIIHENKMSMNDTNEIVHENNIEMNDNEIEINGKNENLQDINNSPIQLIDQLKGYYYINPVLSLSLAITLFSFAGIPPLIGFFGKQMILSAAIDNGYIFMALVAILTSVISAVYYLAIIKQIFFDKPDYTVNTELKDFNAEGLIFEKDVIIQKVSIKITNIVLSSYLSLCIAIITLTIALFIFIPESLLNLANILALILFNI
jgi:NADH-ubiquinone oxidoreductase chain 2